MPDDGRMSNGYNPDKDILASFTEALVDRLDTSLGSVTSELKAITKQFGDFVTDYDKRTPSASERRASRSRDIDTFRRSLPQITKDLKEFQTSLRDAKRSALDNSRRWKDEASKSSYRLMGGDTLSAKRLKDLSNQYAQFMKSASESAELELTTIKEIQQKKLQEYKKELAARQEEYGKNARKIAEQKSSLLQKRETAISKGESTDKIDSKISELDETLKKYKDAVDNAETRLENRKADFDEELSARQEDISKQLEVATERYRQAVEDVQESFSGVEDLIERSRDSANYLKGASRSFSDFMEHNIEKDKDDVFIQNRNALIESIIDANNAIEEKLKDDTLTDEERKNLKAQQELYKRQLEYLRNLTPITDIWRDTGNKIKKTLTSIGEGALKSLVKNLENRYLTTYVEGFQRVYDSIESTRNSISARLKLDQGGFEELQNTIYEEIQQRGLEGVISMSDVDDMITSLSASGITDQAMLQELALEGASLKAGGSSINLGNEEMLQQLMLMYNQSIRNGDDQEEALKKVTDLMEDVASAEIYTRETFGSDTALVNGGIDTAIIQALKLGVSSGKGIEDISKDIQSSVYASQAQYMAGIDASTLQQTLETILEGGTANLDTFGKILYSGGLTQDAIREMGMDKAMQYVADNMVSILENSSDKYFSEYTSAYGLPGSKSGLMTLKNQGGLNVTLDEDSLARMSEIREEEGISKQTGEYYSKTYQIQKQYENTMTKTAITAEKLYRGDSVISDQLNNITNGVSTIVDLLTEAGFDTLKSSSFGSAVGSTIGGAVNSSFVGGAAGLAGAGVAAGVGVAATALAYNFIGKPWQESIESGLSSFETATNEITQKSIEDIDSAQAQIDAANTMLSTFQDMSSTEKKQLLLQKHNLSLNGKILDKQELLNLDDETIQELFKENVIKDQENILAQAEALKKEAEFRSLNTSQLASLEEIFGSSDYGEQNFNRFVGALGGAGSMSDFYNLIGGAEIPTETGDKKFVSFSDMSDAELKQYAMSHGKSGTWLENKSREDIVAELQQSRLREFGEESGWSESTTGVAASSLKEIEDRKIIHEKAVSTLREKWNKLIEEENLQNASPRDILAAYAIKYLTDGYDSSHILIGENGLPTLDNNNGIYYDASAYKEGKMFRTGLTNVPYDQYPAILHKGERVLTAEEADAYNDISSYAVSQLSTVNNAYETPYRVFNTTQYGNSDTSDLKKSIDTQTSSVQGMLSEILGALNNLCRILQTPSTNTAAKQNVLRMNSSLTQLNTL